MHLKFGDACNAGVCVSDCFTWLRSASCSSGLSIQGHDGPHGFWQLTVMTMVGMAASAALYDGHTMTCTRAHVTRPKTLSM